MINKKVSALYKKMSVLFTMIWLQRSLNTFQDGSDPKIVDNVENEKLTAKQWAKEEGKKDAEEFLAKVEDMGALFPLTPNILNYYALSDDVEGLETYIAESDKVHTYTVFMPFQ